jgi:6-phosphogluconate dehydrogenase
MSCDVGIVGLAVMGSNLALNIAEKGFKVAVFNRTYAKTQEFLAKNSSFTNLQGFEKLEDFAKAIKKPRKVLILVMAGAATDSTIEQLTKVLEANDVIVDTGNAHFRDQTKRAAQLEGLGLRFLGMGISGGEEGARKGPAFFPGGTLSVWEEIRPIIEAASAKADDGRPCVTMNGKGGAGSCVKMFHNAGEYAILQIWAEVVQVLNDQGLSSDVIVTILSGWKAKGFLDSYMLDITIEAARAKDTDGSLLMTKVRDAIGSKGTGLWSAQEALEAGVPAPSLNMAVISRQMSMYKPERIRNAAAIASVVQKGSGDKQLIADLEHAVSLSIIASYAQMFQCLRELDKKFEFGLNLPATIATFRAGCILKGYLLKPMTVAFEKDPNLSNLMCAFKAEFEAGIIPFRRTVGTVSSTTSTPIPVLSASLSYVNAMFQPELAYAQVVQLQRDVFGRHGFERLDKEGHFNHDWPPMQ